MMPELIQTLDVHEIEKDGNFYITCDDGWDCCHARLRVMNDKEREAAIRWINICYAMEDQRKARRP